MPKARANRLRQYLSLERRAMPHRNALALYRRPVRAAGRLKPFLRIERGHEA